MCEDAHEERAVERVARLLPYMRRGRVRLRVRLRVGVALEVGVGFKAWRALMKAERRS